VAIPILPVRNLAEARALWAGAGLTVEDYSDTYAFVLADGCEIVHLEVQPGLDPAANPSACYIHVDDVHGWHARLADAGLPVTPVRDEPWGMAEFSVRDPSGNLVRVGRPL
jgi:catechol 2,3-dioxygenase-like lactoylglutathione lyase family enzyme